MKKIVVVFSFLLIFNFLIYGSTRYDINNCTLDINTSSASTKYVVFPIPYEVYNNVFNIGTIWITGNNGEKEVPYFIYNEVDYNSENNLPKTKNLDLEYTIQPINRYNNTIISINNLKNRNTNYLHFDISDEYFDRAIKGDILVNNRNYLTKGPDILNTTLPTKDTTLFEYVELFIVDNDDEPLNIENISATVLQQYIVFEDKGEQYTLHFNESFDNQLKKYDISSFKHEILESNLSIVTTENFKSATEQLKLQQPSQSVPSINTDLILNILLIVIVIIIGTYGALTIVKKKN